MDDTDLQKKLRYYAEQAKNFLESGFNEDLMKKSLEDLNELGIIKQNLTEEEMLELNYSEGNEAMFALRLDGHDLIGSTATVLQMSDLNDSYVKKTLLFVETVGYLATGDETLLSKLTAKELKKIITETSKEVAVSYNNENTMIDAATFVSVCQFLKNARNFKNLKLAIKEDKEKIEYSVSDSGPGIHYLHLPKIFGEYSSKGKYGGFGLQCVKKITDMHEGYNSVFTTKWEDENRLYLFPGGGGEVLTIKKEYGEYFCPQTGERIMNWKGEPGSISKIVYPKRK